MPKLDGDIKKRWVRLSLINMFMLLVVFGLFMTGFGIFAASADSATVKSDIKEYAQSLLKYSEDELRAALADGSGLPFGEDMNPNFSFGIYKERVNGTYELLVKDDFLEREQPPIGGKLDTAAEESVGGHSFITYTARIAPNVFVKVFAPSDFVNNAEGHIALYGIPFIIGFIIICIVISLSVGYIEIKPIMESNLKQKSFINDMSHEIRTPLAIIKGNLENVAAMPDSRVGDVNEILEQCLEEVDYMSNMSSGLLSIVRGENKHTKKESIMSEAVSEVVDMYADVAAVSGKGIVASMDYCDIRVDKEKIKQLMTILIDNALKYTSEGDRISIKLKNSADGCVLSVSDTGIGVSKGELELIFDRFYRAENAREIQGTGLGLAIAKSIVESMDGIIKAQNNVPSGLEIIAQFRRS